jgi:predicted transcriptional regulator
VEDVERRKLPLPRELAALYILHRRGADLNYGEAIDILRQGMCMNKKTARNVLKRLRKIGAVTVYKDGGELRVRVRSPWEYLEALLSSYIELRGARCRGPDEEGRTP